MSRTVRHCLAIGCMAALVCAAASAQVGTNITYQGRITDGGAPAGGPHDLQFTLYSEPAGGAPVAGPICRENVSVADGLFTVLLDFGAATFTGAPRFLEVAVRADPAGLPCATGTYVVLTSRQPLTAVPFALRAGAVPGLDGHSLDAADGVPLDAVFVDGAGRVGVGTAAPGMSLEVAGPATLYARPALGVSFGTTEWFYMHSSTNPALIWAAGGALRFGTELGRGSNFTERMRLGPGGDLGVGVNAPLARLHVAADVQNLGLFSGSSTIGSVLAVENTSAGGRRFAWFASGAGNGEGAGKFMLSDVTAGGLIRMAVDGTGNVGIGTVTPVAKLDVAGSLRCDVLQIDGGADVAESFDVAPAGDTPARPGMVVVIDATQIGKLAVSERAYDRRVAGVVSGADGIQPGLVLGQRGSVADGALPVANVGRVWCWCDADAGGAIEAGDLLTTSETPGHAMKAGDYSRAPGATVGKAMSPLKSGRGLVLVLVTLQ